jgi:hypothetical protein
MAYRGAVSITAALTILGAIVSPVLASETDHRAKQHELGRALAAAADPDTTGALARDDMSFVDVREPTWCRDRPSRNLGSPAEDPC